ncbi:MAG: hypothetical protein AB7L13_05910 [Acidimicrobiia bacterium]
MEKRLEVAAGILLATADSAAERKRLLSTADDELRWALNPSSVWQGGVLGPDLPGEGAYGQTLPRWRPPGSLTKAERDAVDAAWLGGFRALEPGRRAFLRLRVGSVADAQRLRELGEIDSLLLVPVIEGDERPPDYGWHWPLRVAVGPGAHAPDWLAPVQGSYLHGRIYEATHARAGEHYEVLIVDGDDLTWSTDPAIDGVTASSIVWVTADPATTLGQRRSPFPPLVEVAVNAPPSAWWPTLLHELAHDVPLDAAVEAMVRDNNVEAYVSGPPYGLDITAAAHWFAAVAVYDSELAGFLDDYTMWDWRHESGGASRMVHETRHRRDIRAPFFPLFGRGAAPPEAEPASESEPEAGPLGGLHRARSEAISRAAPPELEPSMAGELPPDARPTHPRRLITRLLDGDTAIKTVLPPERDLTLAVRIAVPEADDIVADAPGPELPKGHGPTVELDVVVRSDSLWGKKQPAPQRISISREHLTQPSTWAAFDLTTPAAGHVVEIEIMLLYKGKPLQAATFVAPVRAKALPGEKPTLTTFALSGPDEPTDDLQPVDVTLDGRGAELTRVDDNDATVLITGVQAILDKIEDRVSRVLGVPDAPSTLDDKRSIDLLITLARIGVELATFLSPLALDGAKSINVLVNPDTRVLPLELVYAGPPPDPKKARLCDHVEHPPDPGTACDKASKTVVCPYAFWGLHRTIARTVAWPAKRTRPAKPSGPLPVQSTLYAATVIADEGAAAPLPTASVFEAAEQVFPPVTRVTSWSAWRKAVKTARPALLVLLGHTMTEGGETNLYIGKKSALSRVDISTADLCAPDSPPPLVLLIACATAALGDPFGTLPGTLTAKGAGAVVGTLSKITGPHGAVAINHLLKSFHDANGESVGTALTSARRSLIAAKVPVGLMLVSHGEIDTKVLL